MNIEDETDFKIQSAFSIVRNVFIENKDCYEALLASIVSALRESAIVWEEWECTKTAKKIADRIIGNG